MHAPQLLGRILAPASSSVASVPSFFACSAMCNEAGATNSRALLATLRPRRMRAAILKSSSLAPVHAPTYAWSTAIPTPIVVEIDIFFR